MSNSPPQPPGGPPQPPQPPGGPPQPPQPPQPPGGPPQPPWQPGPSSPGPPGGSPGTGGQSLLGILLGLFMGLILPPGLLALGAGALSELNIAPSVQILVPLAVAIVTPVALFVFLIKRMDQSVPSQAAFRTALVATGYTSLGLWAVATVLIGACFALLAGAY